MSLKDVARNAVELVAPPSAATVRQRLDAARQALVAAEQAVQAAQAAVDQAHGLDDDQAGAAAVLKAEASRAQARIVLERCAGRVAALERQLQAAEQAQAADALKAGRKHLAALKADREQHGAAMVAALAALETACAAFMATEQAVMALPTSIRGSNASVGYNLGAGPLQAHLAVELRQRSITGRPSSSQPTRLAEWLDLGNRTLGS
jgi:type IV secretory pathway VirJ component